jgi:G3E family GTPase
MSEVNIDKDLIEAGASLSRTEEKLVEFSNGCICCTLREDLAREVEKLVAQKRFDYILVESTGIGEPLPVAQTFTVSDAEAGFDLSKICRLDTMVTVVDAARFAEDLHSAESLADRNQSVGNEDGRDVSHLLMAQVEFCDVLVLNKCDSIPEDELLRLEALLRKFQPRAHLVRSSFGKIAPKEVLGTKRFDFDAASESPGWMQELNKEEHTPESEEYGISSFVFRARVPFHPERLAELFADWPEEVVRAKGYLWIATRNEFAVMLQQAGRSLDIQPSGYWYANTPKDELTDEDIADCEDVWEEPYGDRRTECVFIGVHMDSEKISTSLRACLLTQTELGHDWFAFNDPLPEFLDEQEDDEASEPTQAGACPIV